ncbi:hypothetical protein DX912_07635 [Lysobacter soli]|uniref:Outer membrane protein beta-barrel domain-containing protein n=1 Tax=Lysobacter soli TaxID=453783 RepID=A0A3D8VEJ1_9GAMM|nr:outer membrane beta-barrel protein [Lysobacter soli]RDY67780.1 hypothetical protein DX912_07635 [Lysobacter soli]
MEKALACVALLAVIPMSGAVAGGLTYTYVEGGFDRVDQSAETLGAQDPSGAYLRGSYALTPSLFVFGSYAERDDTSHHTVVLGSLDPFQTHTKMEQRATEAGLGVHAPMGERLDFVGELTYFNIDRDITFTVDGGEATHLSWRDLDGTSATVGLRGASERIEGWIKVGYRDSDDFRDHFIGALGAQYRFTGTWGVVAEWEESNELRRYRVGLRASF